MSEHSIAETNAAQDAQTRDETGQYERGQRAAGQDGRKSGQALARELREELCKDLDAPAVSYYFQHVLAEWCERNEWCRRRLAYDLESAKKTTVEKGL